MTLAEDLMSLIRRRRSVRRFKPDPVPRRLVVQLIESAGHAPSAGNRQDWTFTVVTSESAKGEMAEAVRRRWDQIVAANRDSGLTEGVAEYCSDFGDFERAPAVIVVSARRASAFERHMLGEDVEATVGSRASAAMAAQNLMLAAHALGLGTCCMTGALAARAELGAIMGLDRKHEIVCLIALGLPDEAPGEPPRTPVDEILRYLE